MYCNWPPGGGLFLEVRMTKPKPSVSLRCRVTSKHSGREGWCEGWAGWGPLVASTRGSLGEPLTRAEATWWGWGCWLPSSSSPPSDNTQKQGRRYPWSSEILSSLGCTMKHYYPTWGWCHLYMHHITDCWVPLITNGMQERNCHFNNSTRLAVKSYLLWTMVIFFFAYIQNNYLPSISKICHSQDPSKNNEEHKHLIKARHTDVFITDLIWETFQGIGLRVFWWALCQVVIHEISWSTTDFPQRYFLFSRVFVLSAGIRESLF